MSFFAWLIVTTVMTLRAITAQQDEGADSLIADYPETVSAMPPLVAASLQDRVEALSTELAAVREEFSAVSHVP